MSNDKIRSEFEAWYEAWQMPSEAGWFVLEDDGDYYRPHTDTAWNAWQAALSQSEPVCGMCNGHGMIGGFVNAENGFESNPCPECAVEPVQVSQPVGYFAQLNTGEYIQLLDPQDISEVTPLYTSPPDYQATATAYAQAVDQVIALQNENEALKAENKELKKDVDCYTSANISFKRIKTNLQAENEALRKHLLQAQQAATVEAKIADEFRAECDVLRQRVAELEINRDDIAALASESYLERDRLQIELTKSDAGYRMALDQCVDSANKRVRLQSECDKLVGLLQHYRLKMAIKEQAK